MLDVTPTRSEREMYDSKAPDDEEEDERDQDERDDDRERHRRRLLKCFVRR